MVDGRKSLIAYHGKEGGDYYYGTLALAKDTSGEFFSY